MTMTVAGTVYHLRAKSLSKMTDEQRLLRASCIVSNMNERGVPAEMLIPQQTSDIVFVTGSLAKEREIIKDSLPESWQDSLRELDGQLRQQSGLNIYI